MAVPTTTLPPRPIQVQRYPTSLFSPIFCFPYYQSNFYVGDSETAPNDQRSLLLLPPPSAMAGTASPSADGPTYAPPSLPAGWIAQWDGSSKKYYYVQLSTGVSQWEIPTEAVQTGNTPAQVGDHPYGTPGAPHPAGGPQPQVITHPDGSQTVRHADGTMEPILPDGMRGGDGPNGDRGLGVGVLCLTGTAQS